MINRVMVSNYQITGNITNFKGDVIMKRKSPCLLKTYGNSRESFFCHAQHLHNILVENSFDFVFQVKQIVTPTAISLQLRSE